MYTNKVDTNKVDTYLRKRELTQEKALTQLFSLVSVDPYRKETKDKFFLYEIFLSLTAYRYYTIVSAANSIKVPGTWPTFCSNSCFFLPISLFFLISRILLYKEEGGRRRDCALTVVQAGSKKVPHRKRQNGSRKKITSPHRNP